MAHLPFFPFWNMDTDVFKIGLDELQKLVERGVPFVSELPGKATSSYRLLKRLGCGANAYIFSAERQNDGTKLALKIPRDEWAPRNYFEQELQTHADLTEQPCENVVRFLDVAESQHPSVRVAALVMELGHIDLFNFWETPWKDRVTGNTLTVMLGQIWNGLAHLHTRGYAHNDLHPDNILIDARTGTVKLCDFGLTEKASELVTKCEVAFVGRTLSSQVSELCDRSNSNRVYACSKFLQNDAICRQHPKDIEKCLRFVFGFRPQDRVPILWEGNIIHWEEQVAEKPHLRTIAAKALLWKHTNPDQGHFSLSSDAASIFARCLGFDGYKEIDTARIAADFRRITTEDMKHECTEYFQEFLKQLSNL